MATILPVDEIIEIGKASTYLSANYVSTKNLWGGTMVKPTPPITISMVTDALEWGEAGGAQTEASLRSTGNYLYWLCGLFQLQAQNIISGSGGGSVSPTPGGFGSPNPLDFIVDGTTFIATGEDTVTIPQFIGYNVEFDRNGQPQYTTDPGDGTTYFSWNKVTGEFSLLNGAAQETERFRIVPTI